MGEPRFLDDLAQHAVPRKAGREPYWRPQAPPCTKEVREPAWSWELPLSLVRGTWQHVCGTSVLHPDHRVISIDCNGAYLAAASTVEVGHGPLTHTGRVEFNPRRPGFWEVEVHPWPLPCIVSPLGMAEIVGRAWLTTPTVQLLDQLAWEGYWPGVKVFDSWTAEPVRLRGWADHVQRARRHALLAGDSARYDAVKTAYSQAVTTMALRGRASIYRPDWSAHIRTQHAANQWRRWFGMLREGHHVLAARAVDELVITGPTLDAMRATTLSGRKAPVVIDQTGVRLGSFKVKSTTTAREWTGR